MSKATGAIGVLAKSQGDREIVQEYCPLPQSLEWNLGQFYFRERGNKAFLSDAIPVPFLINNDGTLSRNAAKLFFANCSAADRKGALEEQIFVLEIGIGVGLFARFFLDHFREYCEQAGKDYYHRLCYVAADKSERMLRDFLKHGLLTDHPGRFRVRPIDAMEPDRELPHDAMFSGRKGRPFRAVFLNYLLDCLPASILDFSQKEPRELCVRTCVGRNVNLKDHTDMSLSALQERAKLDDESSWHELMEVFGVFASEYDFRPAKIDGIPYGRFAMEFGRNRSSRLMHNFGAIQCLERLLPMVEDSGFILTNEYGQTRTEHGESPEHQRFSFATAVGLNFPLLRAYFEGRKLTWVEPPHGEGRGIESRLLGHRPTSETVVEFLELFHPAQCAKLNEPVNNARGCLEQGRFEMAANFYREALEAQPKNWFLLGEISNFLTMQMGSPKAGADMAKLALDLNPTCSAELWNALGDALFAQDRTGEAKSAYHKALEVNSTDIRSRFNLAWVHAREKDYGQALAMVADALTHDKTGKFREPLLRKQQEILGMLAQKNQQEYLLYVNYVSHDARSIRWEGRKEKTDQPTAPPPPASPIEQP